MKFRLAYIFLFAGLILSSCSDLLSGSDQIVASEASMRFCASNFRMLTKSGLKYEFFDIGTKYLLYGVETADEYDWDNAILNQKEAEETEGHLINYGEDLHFRDKTYDFYAATVCSGTRLPIVDAANSRLIPFEVEEGKLEDLMYSNNLKGCTRTSGLMRLNFIHALSKVQVEVTKENEDESLKHATVHGMTLKNTHADGTLDIISGKWDLGNHMDRTFDGSQMLIFPNEDGRALSLEIKYSLDEAGADIQTAECEIRKPGSDNSPFVFEQNHKYTLSIILSNDGTSVVSVLPKVYDWIDIPVDSYLGQPVTFGNLMWMDRNLGALSADYENDWYNTIGHYFQFGRNIPYILDIEKFKAYTGDGYNNQDPVNFKDTIFVMKYRNIVDDTENIYHYYNHNDYGADGGNYYTRKINATAAAGYKRRNGVEWNNLSDDAKTIEILRAVQCIYTYNHLGEKVYGITYVEPNDITGTGDDVINKSHELVRSPDRIGAYAGMTDAQLTELYKFGFGTKDPTVRSNLRYPTVWTFNNSCGRYYWEPGAPELDPCPKGWRLPSKTDLEVLMPTKQINWNRNEYPQSESTETEDIRYGKTADGHHVCYILKNKGTDKAYRLRIMSHYTADGFNNKRYFSIARYGATSADRDLSGYLDGQITSSSKETTMWANPIEIIKYPACGFIVPDSYGTSESVHPDLRSFGFGTVIRTADSNPSGLVESSANSFSYVQYLSTTDYELSIQGNSRRSLGDQIRCVRDINATD